MIRINSKENTLEIYGHSEYENKGKDIVCAAVSTLITGSAEIWKDEKEVKIYKLENKYLFEFNIQNKKIQSERNFLEQHLRLISQNYPENVSYQKIK